MVISKSLGLAPPPASTNTCVMFVPSLVRSMQAVEAIAAPDAQISHRVAKADVNPRCRVRDAMGVFLLPVVCGHRAAGVFGLGRKLGQNAALQERQALKAHRSRPRSAHKKCY